MVVSLLLLFIFFSLFLLFFSFNPTSKDENECPSKIDNDENSDTWTQVEPVSIPLFGKKVQTEALVKKIKRYKAMNISAIEKKYKNFAGIRDTHRRTEKQLHSEDLAEFNALLFKIACTFKSSPFSAGVSVRSVHLDKGQIEYH